jgi:hypothetical protein
MNSKEMGKIGKLKALAYSRSQLHHVRQFRTDSSCTKKWEREGEGGGRELVNKAKVESEDVQSEVVRL